jgi:hypothetical protein
VYAELESLALHVAKGQLKAPEKIGAAAASILACNHGDPLGPTVPKLPSRRTAEPPGLRPRRHAAVRPAFASVAGGTLRP